MRAHDWDQEKVLEKKLLAHPRAFPYGQERDPQDNNPCLSRAYFLNFQVICSCKEIHGIE
jgi:hypothetical protein